jgi:hypothetical protein
MSNAHNKLKSYQMLAPETQQLIQRTRKLAGMSGGSPVSFDETIKKGPGLGAAAGKDSAEKPVSALKVENKSDAPAVKKTPPAPNKPTDAVSALKTENKADAPAVKKTPPAPNKPTESANALKPENKAAPAAQPGSPTTPPTVTEAAPPPPGDSIQPQWSLSQYVDPIVSYARDNAVPLGIGTAGVGALGLMALLARRRAEAERREREARSMDVDLDVGM